MAGYSLYPSPTGTYSTLASERAQQVDELLRQFAGCRAATPDRSVLDLPLELRDGGRAAALLRVTLPPHFPQERPALSVLLTPPTARLNHPAVDAGGRVHTPQLAGWAYGASRLSGAVAEAVALLTADAGSSGSGSVPAAAGAADGVVPYPSGYPTAAPGQGPLSASRPNLSSPTPPGRAPSRASPTRPGNAAGGGGGSSSSNLINNLSGTGAAAAAGGAAGAAAGGGGTGALPDFGRMPAERLEELLRDGAAFKALLRDAILASPVAAALADIRAKNRQLAEANLERRAAVGEARNQLAVVRSSEYGAIRARLDLLAARQARVLRALGGAAWRERLEEAVSAADAAGAALAGDFLRGDVPLGGFVARHVEARAAFHALDLKRQAAEQLLAGDGSAEALAAAAAAAAASAGGGASASAGGASTAGGAAGKSSAGGGGG